MAGFEIIDATTPLNPGREYLNIMYSGQTIIWSGSTGTDSLIRNINSQLLKNVATGEASWASGSFNRTHSKFSVCLWGSGNTATTAQFGIIINGKENEIISGECSVIINGSGNTMSANHSLIGGGIANMITAVGTDVDGNIMKYTTILGGFQNVIEGLNNYSTILGGTGNTMVGDSTYTIPYSTIVNGRKNDIKHAGVTTPKAATIISGIDNLTSGEYSVILNGTSNTVRDTAGVMLGSGGQVNNGFQFQLSLAATITDPDGGGSGSIANNTITLVGETGEGHAEGGFSTGPADIAEMFEFEDGNPLSEDRRGLFVSLTTGGTIEIGNKNILGAVSAHPGYLGDSAESKWSGIYETDEIGSRIFDTFKIFNFIENGIQKRVFQSTGGTKYLEYPSPVFPTGVTYNGEIPSGASFTTITAPKITPEYNPTEEYIPRSKRKEWAPVGLLGKLNVRTAEEITGTHIDVNEHGMAINGSRFIVIKHIEPYQPPFGIIQIFIK